jgi:hypothetical protein
MINTTFYIKERCHSCKNRINNLIIKASLARIPFPIVRVLKLCIEWYRGEMCKLLVFSNNGFLLHVVEQVV